jgi:Uma2 family endonuclease
MEDGLLKANGRNELIRGIITDNTTPKPPHDSVRWQLMGLLRPLVPPRFAIASRKPVTLLDSALYPDIACETSGSVVPMLVVEVAERSLETERGPKLRLYAEARVPVYWIVNLRDRAVEVYRQPRPGRTWKYRVRTDYTPGQAVPVVVGKKAVGSIPVNEILP